VFCLFKGNAEIEQGFCPTLAGIDSGIKQRCPRAAHPVAVISYRYE